MDPSSGYVAGGTAVTVARRNFPKQFMQFHRAGLGAITSPQVSAATQLSSTPSFARHRRQRHPRRNQNIAFMLQKDEADGPYYHQEWQGWTQAWRHPLR